MGEIKRAKTNGGRKMLVLRFKNSRTFKALPTLLLIWRSKEREGVR